MTQKAKKWLFGIFVAAVLVAGTCLVIDKVTRDDQAKIFTEYITEDFNYAKSLATDSTNVFVYEVEGVLSKAINDRNDNKPLDVLEYQMVYQTGDSVYFRTRNVETGAVSDTCVFGKWFGSMNITDVDFNYNYLNARRQLYKANIVLPEGNKVTLRNPTSSNWGAPLWIFGTNGTGFVYVRTDDGKVATMGSIPDEVLNLSGVQTDTVVLQ